MSSVAVVQTEVAGFPVRRGKVRDVYDLGETLAVVATDRISAFDWVMPDGIPGKGELLTKMATFWFGWLGVPHHLLSTDLNDLPKAFRDRPEVFTGRTMHVRKASVVPIECVARGYLAGSGWKEYRLSQTVCGIPLPEGLKEASKLPQPIFTPATKAETGHDENISFEAMAKAVGESVAKELKEKTLDVYRRAAEYAGARGIILADTKFEWGTLPNGDMILIDEVLTPDSSRYWPRDTYREGISPPSFDKQFLRDWLETTTWDKASPPPKLPAEVISKTAAKYREAYERLVGAI
ncbi:MAG: phosphoribosylaminoimidazolesuccinocarboxamide synthase [Gemmataceae bacterium]